ncbi:MAG: hypothetical protein KF722_02890 [Nitrospira sp.]|nr:hypothetical protein [Nitrospira sp.]
MGLFDWLMRRRPTAEQEQRLLWIKNPLQRKALHAAIAKGEDIPMDAWAPIPENIDPLAIRQSLQNKLANFRERLQEQGTTLEALIEFDPKGAAQAMDDPGLLQEILKRMHAH